MASSEDVFSMEGDDLFGASCSDAEDELISVEEIVSLLVGNYWLWGSVSAFDGDHVVLTDISVVDTVSTPPRRGGKTATASFATVRLDAVKAVVRGSFNEWRN